MKHDIIFAFVFLNSFFVVFSVVQQWNLENSAVDLFASATYQSIKVIEESSNKLYVKLFKYIGWDNGKIVYRKYLTVSYDGTTVFNDKEVDFDNIESYHHFENDNIICPKGKYHPTYFYDNKNSSLSLSSFSANADWELKCVTHEQGYFLVFYLMNGGSQFFYKKSGSTTWNNKVITSRNIWSQIKEYIYRQL